MHPLSLPEFRGSEPIALFEEGIESAHASEAAAKLKNWQFLRKGVFTRQMGRQ
jgi:hypothetical protein